MIPRYSRKEMSSIWSDENKFKIWLEIEILATEAQSKFGLVPVKSFQNIKNNCQAYQTVA